MGKSSEVPIVVLPDPNLNVDAAAWTEQQQFLERLSKDITDMHESVNSIRKAKKQVNAYNDQMKDLSQYKELNDEGKELVKKMDAWEKNIIEERITNGQDVINWPSKLNAEFFNVKSLADSHDPRLTNGVKNRLTDLESQWTNYKNQYNGEIKTAIDTYNQKYQKANVPAVMLK